MRPQKVLFLKYEEIVSDPVKVVKSLAGFFYVPFIEEEERGGVPQVGGEAIAAWKKTEREVLLSEIAW